MQKLTGADLANTTASRMTSKWDWDEGESVSVERLLQGQSCYRRRRRTAGTGSGGRIIRLVVNLAEHCGRSGEEIAWRCYAALRAVDDLEAAGYRCEIVGVAYSSGIYVRGTVKDTAIEVTIKQAEEPVNLASLAAALSPGAFRWHIFNWYCADKKETHGHLGHPGTVTEETYARAVIMPRIISKSAAEYWLKGLETTIGKA